MYCLQRSRVLPSLVWMAVCAVIWWQTISVPVNRDSWETHAKRVSNLLGQKSWNLSSNQNCNELYYCSRMTPNQPSFLHHQDIDDKNKSLCCHIFLDWLSKFKLLFQMLTSVPVVPVLMEVLVWTEITVLPVDVRVFTVARDVKVSTWRKSV